MENNLMEFAMQLADAVELATSLKLTIDCNGNCITINKWAGVPLGNSNPKDELYSAMDIATILGWLDGMVFERNRIRKLS